MDKGSTAGWQLQHSNMGLLPKRGERSAASGEAPAYIRRTEAGPMAQRHAEALKEDGRAVRPPEPRPLSGWPGRPGRKKELPTVLDLYLSPTV